jgi:hypothetical protein
VVKVPINQNGIRFVIDNQEFQVLTALYFLNGNVHMPIKFEVVI